MTRLHLEGSPICSEFTSWTASLSVAISFLFAGDHVDSPDARIAIIDTRKLPNLGIYHVVDLQRAGFAKHPYDHEYHVHGVVHGKGYSSVPWDELVKRGILSLLPTKTGDHMKHLPARVPPSQKIPHLTRKQICMAKGIAEAFGPDFIFPVIAATLSHEHRSWQRPASQAAHDEVKFIDKCLHEEMDTEVENYIREPAIMENIVYATGYVEIRQTIELLRMLTKLCHDEDVGVAREMGEDEDWCPDS